MIKWNNLLEDVAANRKNCARHPEDCDTQLRFHLQPQGTWGAWGTDVSHARSVPGYPQAILWRREENRTFKKKSLSVWNKRKQTGENALYLPWMHRKQLTEMAVSSLDGSGPGSLNSKAKRGTECRMGAPRSLKNLPWCGHGLRMKVVLFSSGLPAGDENITPCHKGGWASQNRAEDPKRDC